MRRAEVTGTASGAAGNALLTPSGAGGGQAGSVAKVFDILTRGESGLAQQFEEVMKQEVRRCCMERKAAASPLPLLLVGRRRFPL